MLDAWSIVPRDIQFWLMASLLSPAIYLAIPSAGPTGYYVALCITAISTMSYWLPSIVGGIIIPIIPWSFLGIGMGWLITNAVDGYRDGIASLMASSAADDATVAAGASMELYAKRRSRLFMILGVVLLGAAQIANVAVSLEALSYVLWVTGALSALVFGTGAIFMRQTPGMRTAWMMLGGVYVACHLVVTLVVWASEGLMWPVLSLVMAYVVALLGIYFATLFTSSDAIHATHTVVEALSRTAPVTTTAPVRAAPMSSMASATPLAPSASHMEAGRAFSSTTYL